MVASSWTADESVRTQAAVPISPYVTTLSFLIYLVCRVIGTVRRRGGRRAEAPAVTAMPAPTAAS